MSKSCLGTFYHARFSAGNMILCTIEERRNNKGEYKPKTFLLVAGGAFITTYRSKALLSHSVETIDAFIREFASYRSKGDLTQSLNTSPFTSPSQNGSVSVKMITLACNNFNTSKLHLIPSFEALQDTSSYSPVSGMHPEMKNHLYSVYNRINPDPKTMLPTFSQFSTPL